MDNLDIKREEALERINKARIMLDQELEYGLITDSDILGLFKKDKNYSLNKARNYKELLLRQIICSPFVLCDQDRLSLDLKKLLPMILKIRSKDEIEELEKIHKLGFINAEELKEEKEMVKFIYYLSSEEGRQILKNGKVKNVKSKILYKIKK